MNGTKYKRVYRAWYRERFNLRIPPPRIHRNYQELISPEPISEGWAMDFGSHYVVGSTRRQFRTISVMQEGLSRAVRTETHKSFSARTLPGKLNQVLDYRGRLAAIRCGNRPEFISDRCESGRSPTASNYASSGPVRQRRTGCSND